MIRALAFFFALCFSSAFAEDVPGVLAKSYIVTDETGTVVLEHDSKTTRPIASISKLLVAEQIYPMLDDKKDQRLLELALVHSSNQAIYKLARIHNTDVVIASVNDVAQKRGLTSISIEEPSGLSENNQASAEDLAKFLLFVKDLPIAQISTEPRTSYRNIHSTNPLLGKPGWSFDVSKTGFTHPAGGCLATIVEIGGRKLVVVILGSDNVRTRWTDLMTIRSYLASDDTFWHGIPIRHRRHRV